MQAKINREVKEQAAQASFYAESKNADTEYYRSVKEADAAFYAKQQEAAGIKEMAKAYGEMASVLGGPSGLLQYMMLQNGTYEKLAATNAKAIAGLQPKISIWNNGENQGTDSMGPIRNLYQSLPPLLQTVQEQTGIQPPSWLAQMPNQEQQIENGSQGKEVMNLKKNKMVNGDSH